MGVCRLRRAHGAVQSLFIEYFRDGAGAKDRFGSNLAAGIFIYFFWQIFINAGHGSGDHAGGRHPPPFHQLRRQRHGRQFFPDRAGPEYFHAPFLVQNITEPVLFA